MSHDEMCSDISHILMSHNEMCSDISHIREVADALSWTDCVWGWKGIWPAGQRVTLMTHSLVEISPLKTPRMKVLKAQQSLTLILS